MSGSSLTSPLKPSCLQWSLPPNFLLRQLGRTRTGEAKARLSMCLKVLGSTALHTEFVVTVQDFWVGDLAENEIRTKSLSLVMVFRL